MHPAICCRAQSGESGHDMIAVSPWMWHFEWLMLLQEWVMSGESEGGTDEFIAITNQSPGSDRKPTTPGACPKDIWLSQVSVKPSGCCGMFA